MRFQLLTAVQCDLAVPSCGQCIRAGRLCSGRRDPTDLLFVRPKTKTDGKKRKKGLPTSYPNEVVWNIATRSRYNDPRKSSPSPWVRVSGISLDDLGINWFLGTRSKQPEHYTKYVLQHDFFSTYHSQMHDPVISQSIKAAGLAGYANETQQYAVTHAAEKEYSLALRSISRVLSEPDIALRDGVLFAIMVLSMFEGNFWRRTSGYQNMFNHIHGLLSLASLSAKRKDLSKKHRRLMALVVVFFASLSWHHHRPLPPKFFLVRYAALFDETNFLDLIVDLMTFEDSVHSGLIKGEALLSECSRLGDALQHLIDSMPPSAQHVTRIMDESFHDLAYRGVVHCTCDSCSLWIARLMIRSLSFPHRRRFTQYSSSHSNTSELNLQRLLFIQSFTQTRPWSKGSNRGAGTGSARPGFKNMCNSSTTSRLPGSVGDTRRSTYRKPLSRLREANHECFPTARKHCTRRSQPLD